MAFKHFVDCDSKLARGLAFCHACDVRRTRLILRPRYGSERHHQEAHKNHCLLFQLCIQLFLLFFQIMFSSHSVIPTILNIYLTNSISLDRQVFAKNGSGGL